MMHEQASSIFRLVAGTAAKRSKGTRKLSVRKVIGTIVVF